MMKKHKLCIIGAGNIGLAIANGLVESGTFQPSQITLTRRKLAHLETYREKGFVVTSDNTAAIQSAHIVLVAVEPQQVDSLFLEIGEVLDPDIHILISVVSGLSIKQIKKLMVNQVPIIRAMPNTAVGIRQSMTCLAVEDESSSALELARSIFNSVGESHVIDEEQMSSATALAACGIAFFLRMIRAASQGGIEIGFHPETALLMASQTAKGAASLLLSGKNHPEYEIDRVTTPRGCTIAGLNQMEHEKLSSAIIKGITTSAEKAASLYVPKEP
ncbi:MAG: pyrroline-5-carboxylate reductase [Acidobacteria bacterium]|nr:MAG: pyrroline-5-carboxylate reductase [Acidobacteriota bacterium]PIE90802.1 MAG: pyrroline-5-carboxylate reductase [Acidobacteriota bacterium]